MICLEDYISKELPYPTDELIFKQLWSFRSLNGLQDLARYHFIVQNPTKLPLPQTSVTHRKMIDDCIVYMINKKLFNNVLTYGYRIAKNSQLNTTLHCQYTNTNISALKMGAWQLLHEAIGTQNFVHMLVNCSIFHYNGRYFKQLAGNVMNEPHKPPIWYFNEQKKFAAQDLKPHDVGNNGFLYRNIGIIKWDKLLPEDVGALSEQIFDDERHRVPKVTVLLAKMMRNASKVRYARIINSICPKKSVSEASSNLDLQTTVKSVTRLITLFVDKIIPLELFGSRKNKSLILKRTSELLRLKINCQIPFEYLIKGLRVTDVSWLGLTSKGVPVCEFKRRRRLFELFLDWLFRKFIPKLIHGIFYATEISSQTAVIYFRQDTWNEISAPFLSKYFSQYLKENADCELHDTFKFSRYNHRNLRLIPKKSKYDFRVLAVPHRGFGEDDRLEYEEYVRTVLKPIKNVLNYLRARRATHFQKMYSPLQIGKFLNQFKETLLNKYSQLPPLHYFKFDIASCYDSVPTGKVFEIVEKLMGDDTHFYIRTMLVYDTRSQTLQRKNVVNGDLNLKDRSILIDTAQTVHFSKADIINTLMMEINQTALKYDDHCFLRTVGLFQGAHLSSCLVDIVYDDLLEYYREFSNPPGTSSLLLRLADDFLIISTSKEYIDNIKTLALNGFDEYNAIINKDKILSFCSTEAENHIFSYCAMAINILKLDVCKPKDTYNMMQSYMGSTKKLYKKLRWLFELRMPYDVTSPTCNSWEAIVRHTEQASINLAETFSAYFAKHKVTVASFSEFIEGIIFSACKNCKNMSDSDTRYMTLRTIILKCFKDIMLIKRSKFAEVVEFLESEQNNCLQG
ncbi:telomerase reverse transcriptase Ecym_1438 [Eremothecium cymbalariae DBVPG|uniref:Telomerase reverse transcriptase n=1 Tax=Eremothecium cymbalariae (strain CBS 270.75 / DBVPG 7215 / KCTC 17166 / NRRL Y-17582) TaxID=931890 RepID=G8JM93_ERECY|nr:hypothetical protein Ecym_1438 [Eremothecium cymbalariae DBVPG\